MVRQTRINPEGTLLGFGQNVRLERGMTLNKDGHAEIVRDAKGEVIFTPEPVWIVFRKVDVTDDPDTTYTYRFEEVSRHEETELGEPPQSAIDAATAAADQE